MITGKKRNLNPKNQLEQKKRIKHTYQALKTYQIINKYLYDDIACIIYQYLCGSDLDKTIQSKEAGFLGIYELIHDVYAGFDGACEGGHLEIINLMIEKERPNLNWGLHNACKGGNLDAIVLMIEKGANNWNDGLYGACQGGHLTVAQLMIEKGANDWTNGLYCACEGGHLSLVKFMIEKGAMHLNIAFNIAIAYNHNNIRNYIQNIINKS